MGRALCPTCIASAATPHFLCEKDSIEIRGVLISSIDKYGISLSSSRRFLIKVTNYDNMLEESGEERWREGGTSIFVMELGVLMSLRHAESGNMGYRL